MITGVHAIINTGEAEASRAFFRDVLEFDSVDTGGGWLVFALPPAELGVHPTEGTGGGHELYLMCDDINATVKELEGKGVEFVRPVEDAGWGLLTAMRVPGGGELGIYEPRHASPDRDPSATNG
ncbi:VOC family protein [Actinophytocola oryzae]|uniref:Glyoxalase/bleomycin resistance protein/dioxygenase superfamily protein n=1 Tax=Actinophytocola oryzae TaxID=502181 RepID=A0A4R7W236_9PSEU|nr:VOC family protein [Actinophytocola oryzae]TDV56502.1 glyoxalase/bleomycin resistance protein/dioxygenase superfamily protein [Actinophytocola oryzae]